MDRLAAACFDHPALVDSDLAIVLTGEFFRSSWRYQDRAYRRICLDTGHVAGNLALAAPWAGRQAIAIGSFLDDAVNDLLFLERGQEEALMIVALPRLEQFQGQMDQLPAPVPSPVSSQNGSIPPGLRILAIHGATRIPTIPDQSIVPRGEHGFPVPPERLSWLGAETLEGAEVAWEDVIREAIIRRRSTRSYAESGLTRTELATLLDFTYRPDRSEEPMIALGQDMIAPGLLNTYVVIHRVEGIDPGCYHYDPTSRRIRQLRFKNLARETQAMVLGQELGGLASAVVFQTTRLSQAVARYGDRAYRHVHLDAGMLGQRLNVAAIALGLGASGIGGFYDDEVNEALGIPDDEAVVYITTLGHPYRDLKLPV
jgi:SagB-type dehydrogenase family enzyme